MKQSLKNPTMPKEHFEKKMSCLDVGQAKYASKDTMSNPQDLKRSSDALAKYVKKNRTKY